MLSLDWNLRNALTVSAKGKADQTERKGIIGQGRKGRLSFLWRIGKAELPILAILNIAHPHKKAKGNVEVSTKCKYIQIDGSMQEEVTCFGGETNRHIIPLCP